MIMSSTMVKWGGAAGIAAAGLLILSALLNQLSPGEGIVDTPVNTCIGASSCWPTSG